MNKIKAVATLVLLALLLTGCAAGFKMREDTSAQKAIDTYIRGKIVFDGGVYVIKGIETEFDSLHEGVSGKDGYLVSCADFTDGPIRYDVDFYVKRFGFEYRVVKTVLHKKNGIALNELLWMKGR